MTKGYGTEKNYSQSELEYIVKNNHSIELKVNLVLDDLQSPRIHLIYKKSKDLTKLSLAQKEYRKYVRKEKYGLNKSLAGQKAKFSLILKGNFDVISFDNYFLVRNKKNLNEIEYRWGGVVPNEGKQTYIRLSKTQAN